MISFMKGWISLSPPTDSHPQSSSSCSVWFLRTFHIYSSEIHTDSSLYKLINYSHMMSLTPSNNFFFIAECMLSWEILYNEFCTKSSSSGSTDFCLYGTSLTSTLHSFFLTFLIKKNKRRRKRNRSLIYQNITKMNTRKYRMAF